VNATTKIELRGAVVVDQMQPQFAAACAASSVGFFPVAGESSFWLEVHPGIVVNRLLDLALKSCDVKPGMLVTERSYGTLEVHGPDQGQVRRAGTTMLRAIDAALEDALAPNLLTDEVIHRIDDHQAMLMNRSREGMLVLGGDTIYTLEVNPAVYAVLAANEAEKASPIRLVGLSGYGAVGRVRLAGTDAEIEEAVKAARRALAEVRGRENRGFD
jgi:hypothetical protein